MTEETSTDVQDEKNVPSNYYINPHEFYDEIVAYRAKYFAAKLRDVFSGF
jgi:spermidine/putrescine-binding protein